MIQATSKFGIEFDECNVVVVKKRVAKEDSKTPGAISWVPFAYYPKASNGGFRHALDRIASEHTLANADLRSMSDALDELHATIKALDFSGIQMPSTAKKTPTIGPEVVEMDI